MTLKIIKSETEYQQYLDWVDEMLDQNVSPESPEGEKIIPQEIVKRIFLPSPVSKILNRVDN